MLVIPTTTSSLASLIGFALFLVHVHHQHKSLFVSGLSAKLFPDRLHCSSIVHLPNNERNDIDQHQVDEYVDLLGNKSSIYVHSVLTDNKIIYFNQLDPKELRSGRKFVSYNVDTNECKSELVSSWILAPMRSAVIFLLPMEKLNHKEVDISMGPSTLLYAIQETLDDFIYISTIVKPHSRLSKVDVYGKTIDFKSTLDYHKVALKVFVVSYGRDLTKVGKSLANALKSSRKLEINAITACKLDDNESVKNITCRRSKMIFHIEYNIKTEYSTGSIMGKRLDESMDYDFHREPFVQPIGIGCWPTSFEFSWQRGFSPASMKFSGEYTTSYGSKGLSFVAYDGRRGVLRLDRDGRKSIYDLERGISYHIGEFSSANNNWAGVDTMLERCIVLKTSEENGLHLAENAMLRLLGLGHDDKSHHLGSKTIDHVSYEVFEIELKPSQLGSGYNLPILLEPTRFVLSGTTTIDKRFFVTYYVHEYSNMLDAYGDDLDFDDTAKILVPRFIELWEWNTKTENKRLINRVNFAEFSWALDVEPSNDPDTQADLSRVFNIDQCTRDRVSKAELRFRLNQWSFGKVRQPDQVQGLRENQHYLKEVLHEELSTLLGISRLNLAHFDVKVLDTADMIVSSEIVELNGVGLEDSKSLGYAHFFEDTLDDHLVRVYHNRHSMSDCKLDSLTWSHPNWFAYCPFLTACIIIDQEQELRNKLITPTDDKVNIENKQSMNKDNEDLCEVIDYKWASKLDTENGRLAVSVADENRFNLGSKHWVFNFRYFDTKEIEWKRAKLEGFGHSQELRYLDTFSAQTSNQQLVQQSKLLVGMRHSTLDEEPKASRMNKRLKLARGLDKFKQCQLACQMDDLCGSYSVCLRERKNSKHMGEDDCVLSTLRLNGERVGQLVKHSEANKQATDKFEAELSLQLANQTFIMYRDEDCSLHPKDFLADYKVIKTIETIDLDDDVGQLSEKDNPKGQNASHLETSDDIQASDLSLQVKGRHLSLEECAGICYESMETNPITPRFMYCPLDSHCVLGASLRDRSINSRYCYLYAKDPARFYHRQLSSHVAIQKDSDQSNNNIDLNEQQSASTTRNVLDQLKASNLARSFLSLSLDACARECNLHQSKCLAFDKCRNGAHQLCILYSIRSPLSRHNRQMPLLANEIKFYASNSSDDQNKVILAANERCDHYYLKEGFLEVRIKQMEMEQSGDNRVTGDQERRTKVESMEEAIIGHDKKQSEIELNEISETLHGAASLNDGLPSDSGGGLQFLMLLFGLMVGCFGGLYGKESWAAAVNVYDYFKQGRGHANDGLRDLVLNDQQL